MTAEQKATLPANAPWEVGQLREVPFHLSTSDIYIECLVVDTRKVFGRTEYQIAPVSGRGSAWVSEQGPVVGGKDWQKRHETEDTP